MDSLSIARNGLPPVNGPRKKILVLGAGIAGLVAAYELKKQGHDLTILEARNRPGGRIHTLREPFAPGLYAEAGAMRIPLSHVLPLHYVREFGLELAPFTGENDQTYYFLQNRKLRIAEAKARPACIPYEFAEREGVGSVQQMWRQTIRPIAEKIRTKPGPAWQELHEKYDSLSLRQFLEKQSWSEEAMELFGLLENHESEMDISILEILREELDNCFCDLYQIKGGMDRLPHALYRHLNGQVRFGAVVRAIGQDADGVTAVYHTPAGKFTVRADYMICTIPFAVLRHIDILQPFSREKQKAIRELHYHASGKIFLQTAHRFWEEEGIYGGATITDLPIRNLFYPEHGRETGRGVLLASYTWGEDALRWSSLTEPDRVREAMELVAKIHPQMPAAFEHGVSVMWQEDPFAGGAYAFFEAGQERQLAATCSAPEGRIFFAGEHTSQLRAWIQGAMDSGIQAALMVHRI